MRRFFDDRSPTSEMAIADELIYAAFGSRSNMRLGTPQQDGAACSIRS
jgi:hypothetical protein